VRKKYGAAAALATSTRIESPYHPLDCSECESPVNAEPTTPIATAATAGLMRRLVQRFEVRAEARKASEAAARQAASTPTESSARKTKISAAAKELLVPGSFTGNAPATIEATHAARTWSCIGKRTAGGDERRGGQRGRAREHHEPPVKRRRPVVVRHQRGVQLAQRRDQSSLPGGALGFE
jgi:hypothetical protein